MSRLLAALAFALMPDLAQLQQMTARFAPVTLHYDEASLSPGDRQALAKLIEAARVLNYVFMDQLWKGALYAQLRGPRTVVHRRPKGSRSQKNLLREIPA
jgi:hypothetical protein